jgi:hypothetical protein
VWYIAFTWLAPPEGPRLEVGRPIWLSAHYCKIKASMRETIFVIPLILRDPIALCAYLLLPGATGFEGPQSVGTWLCPSPSTSVVVQLFKMVT